MAESFPNMKKDLDIPIYETKRSPPNLNPGQSFNNEKLYKWNIFAIYTYILKQHIVP